MSSWGLLRTVESEGSISLSQAYVRGSHTSRRSVHCIFKVRCRAGSSAEVSGSFTVSAFWRTAKGTDRDGWLGSEGDTKPEFFTNSWRQLKCRRKPEVDQAYGRKSQVGGCQGSSGEDRRAQVRRLPSISRGRLHTSSITSSDNTQRWSPDLQKWHFRYSWV